MNSGRAIADPDQLADGHLGRVLGAEVLEPAEVHVPDDGRQRNLELARRPPVQALVEEPLDRLALRQSGEPAQGGQQEPREVAPLDVEVVLGLPSQ
jgi:hypothetical protein